MPPPGTQEASRPMPECSPPEIEDRELAMALDSLPAETEADALAGAGAGPDQGPGPEETADGKERGSGDPEPTDWEGGAGQQGIPQGAPPLYVISGRLGGWDEAAPAPPKLDRPQADPPQPQRPDAGQGKSSLEALLRKVAGARTREKEKRPRACHDRRTAADNGQTLLEGFAEYTKQG